MIRSTLPKTKDATFCVCVPDKARKGFPTPNGTGFFISGDGYFITAHHVVESLESQDMVWLERPRWMETALVQNVKLVRTWLPHDLALLKADFEQNKQKEWLKGQTQFPFLLVDFADQEEGAPVYAFGYPLPQDRVEDKGNLLIGTTLISSRTTSAIIASTVEHFGPLQKVPIRSSMSLTRL